MESCRELFVQCTSWKSSGFFFLVNIVNVVITQNIVQCMCIKKKINKKRRREELRVIFQIRFLSQSTAFYCWKINHSSSKDDLVAQNGGSQCEQRKEKPQSHPLYGHPCPDRNNFSTLEHAPYFEEFLSLTGTGTTLSRNFRMTQPDSYGLFHFCKLQQPLK